MEDDGCFYSVAKSTKKMGLFKLNERKGCLTPNRVRDVSLEDSTKVSVLFYVMDSLGPS